MELISIILLSPFLLILFVWLFLRSKGGAEKSAAIPAELAQRQLDYMRLMNTSPRIKGNGRFSVRLQAEARFQENLSTVREMLQQQYTADSTFMAVLYVMSSTESREFQVRVDVGDETVGLLPAGLAGQVKSDLIAIGGVALVEARLENPNSKENIVLLLDLELPITISA